MPKPARFETEQGQRVAVAVVTITVLVGAMSLAVAYTLQYKIDHTVALQPREIDGLQLNLPTGWTEEQDAYGTVMLLEDRDDPLTQPRRKIVIQTVGRGITDAPMDSLRSIWKEAIGQSLPPSLPSEHLHRFRNHSLVGIRYHGRRSEQEGADTRVYALLLTEDARQYWLITLADRDTPRSASEDDNIALIDRIAQSATVVASRQATSSDLAKSQLNIPLPVGVEGRIGPDAIPGEPVMLVPTQGGIQLGILHATGTIDTGINDPNNQLSTVANLRRAFFHAHRRYPDERELTSTQVNGHNLWRLTLSVGRDADASTENLPSSLIRERVYVELGEGRGLLLDALSEPAMYTYTNNLISQMVESAIASANPTTTPKPDDAKSTDADLKVDANDTPTDGTRKTENTKRFLDAYQRGEQLGKEMRSDLGKRFTERWYFMLEHWRGKLNSVRMTRWYRTDDPELPLWGRSIRRLVDRKQLTRGDWRASEDGHVIDGVKVVQHDNGGKMIQAGYRVQLVGDRLTTTLIPRQDDNQLNLVTPGGYIPMIAAEVWPMDRVYNLAKVGPTLIWQSYETTLPEPMWLEATAVVAKPQAPPTGTTAATDAAENPDTKAAPAAADEVGRRERDEPTDLGAITNPPNGAAAVLTIRPIMGMETTRIWLDAAGQTILHTTYVTEGQPVGGIRVDLTRVTRKAALNKLDSLQETIFQWSMEQPDPGTQP